MGLAERINRILILATTADHAINGHSTWAIRIGDTDYPAQVSVTDDKLIFSATIHGQRSRCVPFLLRDDQEVLPLGDLVVGEGAILAFEINPGVSV